MNEERKIVLIVDDVEISRLMLGSLFEDKFEVLQAADADEAMHLIEQNAARIAVVLLDLNLPGKDGFAVLDFMMFNGFKKNIPVILVTGEDNENQVQEMAALQKGADDFLTKKSIDTGVVRRRVSNMVELYQYKQNLEQRLREETDKFRKTSEFVIDVLMTVMQAKNSNSRASILRIRNYTREILEFLSSYWDDFYALSPDEIDMVVAASVLHDIGEVAVPEAIFAKQPLLSPEERKILESHTLHGCEIVRSMQNMYGSDNAQYIQTALEICEFHHERWDGSGYPNHLAGNQIPVSAQVVGLADTYEGLRSGMLSGRPYTHEEAMYSIQHGEFGGFSPVLTEVCAILSDRLAEIHNQIQTDDTAIPTRQATAP